MELKAGTPSAKPASLSGTGGDGLAAGGIFRLFALTISAMRLYPSYHESVVRFVDDLFDRLSGFLDGNPDLDVRIEESAFIYEGEPVFHDLDVAKSLPYLFFKDGMQSLAFLRGLGRAEFLEFLELVRMNAELPADRSDLVDALWEKDFEHIRYFAPDEFLEAKILGNRPRPYDFKVDRAALFTGRIELAPEDMDEICKRSLDLARKDVQIPAEWMDLLATLDDREVKLLESMLAADRRVPADREFLGLVFEILGLEDRPEPFAEVLSLLETHADTLIGLGDFEQVLQLLQHFDALVEATGGDHPQKAEALRRFLGRVLEGVDLESLHRIARPGRSDDPRWLYAFLARIGPRALDLGGAVYEEFDDKDWKRAGVEYLQTMFRQNPEETAAAAQDGKPKLTKALIDILGRTADRKSVLRLAAFAHFRNPDLRTEAVRALGAITDELAQKALLEYLRDEDDRVRYEAAQAARPGSNPRVYAQFVQVIEDKGFHDRSASVKGALLAALGRTEKPEAAALLRSLLMKKGLFAKAKLEETRLAAVAGLAVMANPAAREALREGARGPGRMIAEACARALARHGDSPSETPR